MMSAPCSVPVAARRARRVIATVCAADNGSHPSSVFPEVTTIKPDTGFGAVVDLTPLPTQSPPPLDRLLSGDPEAAEALRRLFYSSGGLVVLRGLVDITPEQLVHISKLVGEVEGDATIGGKVTGGKKLSPVALADGAVIRLGNTRDPETRRKTGAHIPAPWPLPTGVSPQYRPLEPSGKFPGTPFWHTDSCFRENPPVGSLFYCKQCPADGGGATCFADTRAAFEALDPNTQARLERLECLCSYAHHEAKYHSVEPKHKLLSEAARLAMPAQRQPLVLPHPVTGRKSLYGLNEGTCAVLPKGETFPEEKLAAAESEECVEDLSMAEWRGPEGLLQFATQDRFTVVWRWKQGDLVFWDDRTSVHTATGFDHENCTREMWRTTIIKDHPRSGAEETKLSSA